MAEIATIARPYAEAVFKLAKASDSAAEWSSSLAFLSVVVKDAAVAAIIRNPRVPRQNTESLMLDLCHDQVGEDAKNLVRLLIQNNKLSLVPAISSIYEKFKADDEGYVNVDLHAAYALNKAEQGKFIAVLEKLLNKKVNPTVSVDKSLIGGVLARAGDKVIDGSVRGQLHQLAKRL